MKLINKSPKSAATLLREATKPEHLYNIILSYPAEKRKYGSRIITDRERECC